MTGGYKQNDMKRRPIRQQVQRMVLMLCVAALVVTGMLWAGSLFALRDTVQRDSQGLGESAAAAGSDALLSQMEQNLYQGVQSEAAVVDEKLERYAANVRDFAFYAHRLYEEPESYVPKEVLPPDAESQFTFTMQLVWRDGNTDRAAAREEIGLLANLVHMWQPVMAGDTANIASIYLCTESGFMINYDERSDLTSEYFDYEQSIWYRAAKDAGDVIFTVPYLDTFGRGFMVACAAPVTDADGSSAGVVCMDMMVFGRCWTSTSARAPTVFWWTARGISSSRPRWCTTGPLRTSGTRTARPVRRRLRSSAARRASHPRPAGSTTPTPPLTRPTGRWPSICRRTG